MDLDAAGQHIADLFCVPRETAFQGAAEHTRKVSESKVAVRPRFSLADAVEIVG